jgi:hypothetical protein
MQPSYAQRRASASRVSGCQPVILMRVLSAPLGSELPPDQIEIPAAQTMRLSDYGISVICLEPHVREAPAKGVSVVIQHRVRGSEFRVQTRNRHAERRLPTQTIGAVNRCNGVQSQKRVVTRRRSPKRRAQQALDYQLVLAYR